MPGAATARATTRTRLSASNVPKNPATAIGNHGSVRYQPWPAITAVAASQPPSRTAAAPPSSAARFGLRPARTAPLYSARQVAAATTAGPATVSAHT